MQLQYQAAGSSSTSSSLANALGEISANAPNTSPLPNNFSATNSTPSSVQGNVTVPVTERVQSSPSVPLPAPTSSSSSASQPYQGVPPGQISDLRTASGQPIPLPRYPTPENLFAIKKNFTKWAEDGAATSTNHNNYFYLFNWKVFSVRESDQSVRIVMSMGEETLRLTLGDFLDRFIAAVYFHQRQGPSASSSAAQPSRPLDSRAQDAFSTPTPTAPAAKTPVPQASATTPPGTTQNQNTTNSRTPVPIPNTILPKTPLTSPRQANLKRLARDILYGLGKKRPRELSTLSENATHSVKKHASEVIVQASRTLESENPASKVSMVHDKRTVPLSQESRSEVSKQSTTVTLDGPTIAGPRAIRSPVPASTHTVIVDPRSATTNSSVARPSPTTSTPKEYTPKVAESASVYTSKETVDSIVPPAPSASVPTTNQPPVAVMSSSSRPTLTPSRPGAKANSIIDLTSPPTLDPVASTSKLPPMRSPEPLFLPSSSPEPSFFLHPMKSPGNFDVTEVQSLESGTMNRKKYVTGKKRDDVYVLVPPEPEYLLRYREQVRKKIAGGIPLSSQETIVQELKRGTRTSPVSTSAPAVEEEDFTYALEVQHLSPQDGEEREIVRLACTRLQELPCRWTGCDCILNSVESLIRHFNQHIPSPYTQKPFMCKWTQCGHQVRFKDGHLERHAMLPLRCAYLDCDDSFRSPAQLLKHCRLKHQDGILKPSYKPSPPKPLPLQPLPNNGIIPSYLLAIDLVKGEAMSRERHEALGCWVARNISTSGLKSRYRPRKVKSARASNRDSADANNDYEFLTTRTTRYSTRRRLYSVGAGRR
ncbi:hypothetical protein CPB84DRAFT_79379 [Gymnopilus junonius]|uniref:C2H2-type domain-containing protein n=1 Tax=Gymnopilus junonius TaxID=109634 RepID=A0A9P5P4P6_GYMJU|nr:hypothetical protein CPB84DRAFT_79379 [Gymnopilus junonius]